MSALKKLTQMASAAKLFPGIKENALDKQFRDLCEKIAAMAQEDGYGTRPYTGPEIPLFTTKDEAAKAEIVRSLNEYIINIQSVRAGSKNMTNLNSFWRVLSERKMIPPSDFFDLVKKDDIIEIYDAQGIQIFRSWAFFGLTTYSIEEMYCVPWTDLYGREAEVKDKCVAAVIKVLSGEVNHSFKPDIPVHVVYELKGNGKLRNMSEPLVIAPLKDSSGNICGLIHVFRSLKKWVESADLQEIGKVIR